LTDADIIHGGVFMGIGVEKGDSIASFGDKH